MAPQSSPLLQEGRTVNCLYFAHWLASFFVLNAGDGARLTAAAKQAKEAGAIGFELIWHALNKMSAAETALALKAAGMFRASMCIFFPDGMGDPLSNNPTEFDLAVKNFRQACGFICELRIHGIEINFIDGPSAWVLGKTYSPSSQKYLNGQILRFYLAVADDLREAGIMVAIELLRYEEDKVLQSVDHAIALIDRLNAAIKGKKGEVIFGFHLDVHHFAERGYPIADAIRRLGKRIVLLHLHGTKRRPAGSVGDEMPWAEIIAALKEIGITGVIVTYEPFSDEVRDKAGEALWKGLPPAVTEPSGIIATRATLVQHGMTFMST